MDTSNFSTNGTDYSQQSESQGQSMDHSDESKGGRKAGERIYASKEQEDDKKLFVGGLAWDTTPEKLQAYFSDYGVVLDCEIKRDQVTKKPRGFGFVLFESADSVAKVLEVPDHKVDNKTIDPKPANPLKKPEKKKKIFIGGIGSDLKDDQITEYFSKFGTVVETEFPEDKTTGRRLGFAFVKYETSDEAQGAQQHRFHTISNKKVEVSEAVSREERQQQKMRGGGMGGMRGGRGRGGYGPGFRGGYGGYSGYEDQGFYGQGGYGGGGGGYGSGYGGGYGGGQGGYQYGQYDYSQGGYNQGGGGGYGGYGDYSSGGGGYGGYSGGGGGGGGYGGGGYNGGYEQSEPGKAPVNRRGGGAHHPYSR